MEVSEQLTGFELEDLMSWTVSNLQRPFREDFSLEKSGIIAEKESQIFGRRFVGFDGLSLFKMGAKPQNSPLCS